MARRAEFRREALLFATIIAIQVGLNAGFGDSVLYWGGAWSCGPRHLIPILPFLAVAAAFWRPGIAVSVPLVLWSALVMLAAVSVEPRFDPAFANPIFDYALPLFFSSSLGFTMGLSYLSSLHFGGHSWNLGRVFGLDGSLQLLPLLTVWAAAIVVLVDDLKTASVPKA
jgi:hypothetical protein